MNNENITENASAPSNDTVISTLNGLIETCKNGEEGFKTAAEAVKEPNLKSIFSEYSQQRAQFAGELKSLVTSLGGDPETGGSIAGALHRGWLDLKAMVTGGDDGAVLNECERGEDVARDSYKAALGQGLPAHVNDVIRDHFESILAAHQNIKRLRDNANNSTSNAATGF